VVVGEPLRQNRANVAGAHDRVLQSAAHRTTSSALAMFPRPMTLMLHMNPVLVARMKG
jgi:hypothetical protein